MDKKPTTIFVLHAPDTYNKEKQEQFMSEDFVKNTPKLGFGLMRLPNKGIGKDIRQISRMVDMFMEAGFTYFDTAYVYPGSENAIRKALVERYPRESFTLADKLNAFIMAPTEKTAKKQFITSLERTGAGYFDYYLLHSLMDNNYKKYESSTCGNTAGSSKKRERYAASAFRSTALRSCWNSFLQNIRK